MPFYQIDEAGKAARVVDADNPAAALKHAAESRFTISKPLKSAELVAFMGGGGKVEKVGEPVEEAKAEDESGEAGEK